MEKETNELLTQRTRFSVHNIQEQTLEHLSYVQKCHSFKSSDKHTKSVT